MIDEESKADRAIHLVSDHQLFVDVSDLRIESTSNYCHMVIRSLRSSYFLLHVLFVNDRDTIFLPV